MTAPIISNGSSFIGGPFTSTLLNSSTLQTFDYDFDSSAGGEIEFNAGSSTGTIVPEPPPLEILALGLLPLGTALCARRKHSTV